MARRGQSDKRDITPDIVYNNKLVARLINQVLREGKKSLSQRIVYDCFEGIRQKTGEDPVAVFKKAVDRVRPLLEVRSRRVGGATYQVPVEVNARRGITLALRWIVGFAKQRGGKAFSQRLAAEIMEAAEGQGASVKRKEDLHKMAEANRAFAHYRW